MAGHKRALRQHGERGLAPLPAFVSTEALSGFLLFGAAVAALIWINTAPDSYADVWDAHLTIGIGDIAITETLHSWVNDGLMTLFFFVVGLEVKRELVCGELRDPRTASLPVLAAIGGMLIPAALYAAINLGSEGRAGWGIPMATDIAFGLAVLALLTRRTPRSLRLFVLTLAIVDDIGAIVVIALFYSDDITGVWLLAGLGVVVAMVAMRALHIQNSFVYAVPAVVLWVCVFESGVHATLAGVALGLLTPAAGPDGPARIERLEATFHPWSSFLVVPLFALANAGVPLGLNALRETFSGTVGVGILIGLVIGKPLGICTAVAIGLRTRLARLPEDVTPAHILGAGMLAGIGFTVSLFIAGLSFGGALLDEAKIGILVASVTSGVLGSAVLLRRRAAGMPIRDYN